MLKNIKKSCGNVTSKFEPSIRQNSKALFVYYLNLIDIWSNFGFGNYCGSAGVRTQRWRGSVTSYRENVAELGPYA